MLVYVCNQRLRLDKVLLAVLARHADWEEQFVEKMGSEWALNQRNLQENTIIPHRLKATRPTLSMDAVKDMSDSIDLWGNMFTSSSVDEVSSSQALLLEALSGKTSSKRDGLASKIQLPTHLAEPIVQESPALEIDLIGPTSIQVPVQAKRSGLVSIQEVGIDETPEVEEQGFHHGFSAIVEETADNLQILHRRRRRSQSRRSGSVNDETAVFVPSLNDVMEIDSPLVEDVSVEKVVEQMPIVAPEIEQTEVLSSDLIEDEEDVSDPLIGAPFQ